MIELKPYYLNSETGEISPVTPAYIRQLVTQLAFKAFEDYMSRLNEATIELRLPQVIYGGLNWYKTKPQVLTIAARHRGVLVLNVDGANNFIMPNPFAYERNRRAYAQEFAGLVKGRLANLIPDWRATPQALSAPDTDGAVME